MRSFLEEMSASSVQRHRRQVTEVTKMLAETKAEFHRVIGSETLHQLRTRARDFRRERDNLRRSTETGGDASILTELRRRFRHEITSIVKRAGVDTDALRNVRERRREEFRRILAVEERLPEGLELVPVERVPLEILHPRSNPPEILTPPWNSWWQLASIYMDNGWLDFKPVADKLTGLVGHASNYENDDAGEQLSINWEIDDLFSMDNSSSIGFWWKPPQTGILDLWFKVRFFEPVASHFWVEDTWGIHDDSADMWSKAFIAVDTMLDMNAEVRHTLLWHHIAVSPDDPVDDKVSKFSTNESWWFHLQSKLVAGQTWTFVRIGNHDWRYALLDDVNTKQYMRDRFFVEEVHIQLV